MWINKFIGILAINQKSPKDITEDEGSHCLSTLIQDQATTVMITPLWPTHSRFSILFEPSIDI
jgi:hypothetical protein